MAEVPEGKYPLIGHKFRTPEGVEFLIKARKKTDGKKPREYLCSISVGGVFAFTYYSSLYPVDGQESVYRMEYNGTVYLMTLGPDAVSIAREGLTEA